MSFTMPATVPYGPHEISTKTDMGKELWSYERKPDYDPRKNPYPKMLYKAYKGEDGEVRCMDVHPKPWLYPNMDMYRLACEQVDNFNISCQRTVGIGMSLDAAKQEHETAHQEGWRDSPHEAKQFVKDLHTEMAKANAEMEFRTKNMSEKAQAESRAFQETTNEHVGEIPEARTVKSYDNPGRSNVSEAPKKEHWKTREVREAREAKEAAARIA